MKDAGVKRRINGIAASRGGPKIAHLFFADDSLFFCRAKEDECKELVRILDLYNRASGHEVNVRKLGLLFNKNTSEKNRKREMKVLGFQRSMEKDCYLGLPLLFGRSKAKELKSIEERIRAKVNGWEGRLLLQAGKAVLIQAVGQAISIYSMNCFKLPSGFLQEINMMLARFWWGDVGTKRKMHWKKWEQLCISKLDGGLGFKDMEAFNLELLAK